MAHSVEFDATCFNCSKASPTVTELGDETDEVFKALSISEEGHAPLWVCPKCRQGLNEYVESVSKIKNDIYNVTTDRHEFARRIYLRPDGKPNEDFSTWENKVDSLCVAWVLDGLFPSTVTQHMEESVADEDPESPTAPLFPCPRCDDQFDRKHQMLQHLETHSVVEYRCCTECDFNTSRKRNLAWHMATHHTGGAAGGGAVIVDANDPRKVIVKKLALMVEGMPDKELDLTGDLTRRKKIKIKEGVSYNLRIDFIVQRGIVHGLKYIHNTSLQGKLLDTETHTVGSYAPRMEIQSYITPEVKAPDEKIFRETYSISSHFTDDDNTTHLMWDWKFEIAKDW